MNQKINQTTDNLLVQVHYQYFVKNVCFKSKSLKQISLYLHNFIKKEKQNPYDIKLGFIYIFDKVLPTFYNNSQLIKFPSDLQQLQYLKLQPKDNNDNNNQDSKQTPTLQTIITQDILTTKTQLITFIMQILTHLIHSPSIISRQLFDFMNERVRQNFNGYNNEDRDFINNYQCKIKNNIIKDDQEAKVVTQQGKNSKKYERISIKPNAQPNKQAKQEEIVTFNLSDELVEHLNNLLKSTSRQTFTESLSVINGLNIKHRFNPEFVFNRSIKHNAMRQVKNFAKGDEKLQNNLINLLSQNKTVKHAAEFIKQLKKDPMEYPQVIQRLQKISMRYYLGRAIRKPQYDKDYISLARVQELFFGLTSLLSYLAEDLVKESYITEAAYFITQHSLEKYIRKDILVQLESAIRFNYQNNEASFEELLIMASGKARVGQLPNQFGPSSKNMEQVMGVESVEYLRISKDQTVKFVQTKEQVIEMSQVLLKSKLIGMDMQWKPAFTKFDKTKAAILQVACQLNQCFIIDLIKLNSLPQLNEILTKAFKDQTVTKMGFSFSGDMNVVLKSYPTLTCFRYIAPFVDIQRMYSQIMAVENGGVSLAKCCQTILGMKLCKGETLSNWQKRPLRLSQIHYAALDSIVLIKIYKKLNEMIGEEDGAVQTLNLKRSESSSGSCYSEEFKLYTKEQLKAGDILKKGKNKSDNYLDKEQDKQPQLTQQMIEQSDDLGLYKQKSTGYRQPKSDKQLMSKNMDMSLKDIMSMKFILDQNLNKLKSYLDCKLIQNTCSNQSQLEMKIESEVVRSKWKVFVTTCENKPNSVMLTSIDKAYSISKGPAFLLKEKNPFIQFQQLCKFFEIDMKDLQIQQSKQEDQHDHDHKDDGFQFEESLWIP